MSLTRIIVPLLAAAAGIAGGYAFIHSVAPPVNASDTRTDAAGQTLDTGGGPPPKVNGGDQTSMLRPEEMAKALAVLRKESGGPHGRLNNFRLAPERINTTIDGDGKQTDIYLIPGGKIYTSSTREGSNSFPEDDVTVGDIPAGAPWKIVRLMGKRSGVSPDDVDYMVLQRDSTSGKDNWLIYLKGINRSYYRAALNGAHPTRCC